MRTPVPGAATSSPGQQYGCSHCLRLFESSNLAMMRCKYCDERVEPDEAQRLVSVVDGLTGRVQKGLLEGQTAPALVKSLQEQGIPQDRAFAFVDRLVLELPFERVNRREAGEPITPACECDACGRVEPLTRWEAVWDVSPEEMQRYRKGWGGFEGSFSKPEAYARKALYFLCKTCPKEKPEKFAGGYPAKNGFVRTRFTRSG